MSAISTFAEIVIGDIAEWDWPAMIFGVIGALIGGFSVLWATMLAARYAEKQAVDDRRIVVVGGVRAMWAEITINYIRYDDVMGKAIRNLGPDEYLTANWPLHSEYFSVYSANAALLGELNDDALAYEIIDTITAAKGLLDSLQLNLQMVEQLNHLKNLIRAQGPHSTLIPKATKLETALVEYGRGLKLLDARITHGITEISPRIEALTTKPRRHHFWQHRAIEAASGR